MAVGTKRTKEKFRKARAVWIEDDGEKHGITDPKDFPIPPSIVVQSSPGKYHYYWLTETTDPDKWEAVITSMADKYNGDPAGTLLTQVLRVPGFNNTKYDGSPEVKIISFSNTQYSWDIIEKHFPPKPRAEPDTTKLTKPKFSVMEAINAILSGDALHESRIRLAMHWANSGMPKEDALSTLNGYVEDAIRSGGVNKGRAMERISNMRQAVDSAYEKVEMEQAPKFDGGTVSSMVYTTLPQVGGALKLITENIMEYMPYPSYEMALAVSQHVVSVFGGGLYHISNKTCTRKRTILADTGRGKSIVDKYYNELVRRIAVQDVKLNPYLFNGNNSYAVNNIHLELIEHRVRSYIMSEAGLMGKSTAGTTSETRAYILNAISSSRKSAINAKLLSARTTENRKVNDALKTVYGAVPVFLSESVPAQYVEVLSNADAFRSGDIGREELIFVDPHKPEENFLCEGDIPDNIVNLVSLLARTFENQGSTNGDEPSNPDRFTEAIMGEPVRAVFHSMCQGNNKEQNIAAKNEDYVKQAMLSRVPEKILVTMLVQAIADLALKHIEESTLDGSPPEITLEHFQFALDYHTELNRSLVSQTRSGSMADPLTRCIDRLTSRALEFGTNSNDERIAINYNKKIISRAWITKVLDRSKFKPMDALINRTYGDRDRAMKSVTSYAEDINLLIPVTHGRRQHWKINT
jgi:hypothetical protein